MFSNIQTLEKESEIFCLKRVFAGSVSLLDPELMDPV